MKRFPKISYLVLLIVLFYCSDARCDKSVSIENGVVNLYIDGVGSVVEIEGVAHFYPDTFITDSQLMLQALTQRELSITRSWNNQLDKKQNHSVQGYGTYSFQIKIPEEAIGKSFIIRPNHFISYASEIYINGELVCNNGQVGNSKSDTRYQPARVSHVYPFVAKHTTLNVDIWVSNFNHFRGGIFNKIKFGPANKMIETRERDVFFDLMIIFTLLVMFLYHLILFFVNLKDKVALYFGLTCLIFAINFSFQNTMTFFLAFPNIGFGFSSFLHLTIPYLLPSSFIFFLYSLFPNDVSIKIRNLTAFVTLVFVGITITGISSIIGWVVKFNYAYIFFIILYAYIVSIKAVWKRREGAIFFLVAYFIFSICAINDLLFVFEVIYSSSVVAAGLILFVVLLSILHGRRMVLMYNNNLRLSDNLKELNTSLEKKVKVRTLELNDTIKKLKKLTQFKEDMTNMVIHDLKSSLNSIIHANIIPDVDERTQVVRRSGYHMLNMVQNILDVYRSENAEFKIYKEKVSFKSIVQGVLEEVGLSLKTCSLKFKYEEDKDFSLFVDKCILQRVIVNIVSNAIKYAPKGSSIHFETEWNKDEQLKIMISNSGPAIPLDEQTQIFDRFQQSKSKVKNDGTSGLGLTFCKIAIESHGGKIGVVSEDIGAQFWFTIPQVK